MIEMTPEEMGGQLVDKFVAIGGGFIPMPDEMVAEMRTAGETDKTSLSLDVFYVKALMMDGLFVTLIVPEVQAKLLFSNLVMYGEARSEASEGEGL